MLMQIRSSHVFQAAVFAALFVLIGWRDINPYGFSDLEAYRAGFQSQWYLFELLNTSPIEFFLGEGLWVRLFDTLHGMVGDIDAAFTIVSLTSVFLIGLFVVKRSGSAWYLLFLFNPAFVELTLSQIRSGLACALFWSATLISHRPLKIALLVIAAAIHTSFFLFGLFYLAYVVLENRRILDNISRNAMAIFVAFIVIGVAITSIRVTALSAINDHRALYVLDHTSGILLSVAWLSFAVTFMMFRNDKKMGFEPIFYIFCASMALASAVMDLYGSRFSALAIPALAVMAAGLAPQYRFIYIFQFAFFTAIYFYYWLV
ncbi:MAG: hypothetical protein KF780_02070 [Sphingomonas sp.]|nr:hypothetical protein [Sphingomonas sp.]